MTITNPGAIPNSGAKKFTAQIAQVAKINYNRNLNNEEYNAFVNATWYANNANNANLTIASTPGNSFGNLQVTNGSGSGTKNKTKNGKQKKSKSKKY